MANAQTLEAMSPGLLKVVERAQREPAGRFNSLAHLIDVPALARAYHRQRADAAVGVDGVTKEAYGRNLESNLQDLHTRLKEKRYRHQPIRRVYIPKAQGKTRPIGISAFEDKLVQDAVREVLEAIYEQDFLDCSHGFRPGRKAHDAVRTLKRSVDRGEVRWIYEADIVSFFDSLDRTALKEMLGIRVADGSLMRLIGKCLHVGVLDGETIVEPERGTAQGSVLSALLGNVYLHYVLDLWFEIEVKPRLQGKATLIRYGDDSAPRTHERRLHHIAMRYLSIMRCCAGDEGRPLGAVWQEEAPNHRKLRWSRARVVSGEEKAGQEPVRGVSRRRTPVNRRERVDSVGTPSKPGGSRSPGISRAGALLTGAAVAGMEAA
jgi:retron-type reverse transcriptase